MSFLNYNTNDFTLCVTYATSVKNDVVFCFLFMHPQSVRAVILCRNNRRQQGLEVLSELPVSTYYITRQWKAIEC